MHDRGNGLGGGFAGHGLYPEYRDSYAFHVMFLDGLIREDVEEFLRGSFHLHYGQEAPTLPKAKVSSPPIIWRYFADVRPDILAESKLDEPDFVVDRVMKINTGIAGAFVFSSGKDLGVFKGVGFPEDIAEYFRLDEYGGYAWTAHGRFPTNTSGWWGGAHPFSILDWTVVHNGEISSYGINRRYLEMHGYTCTMHREVAEVVGDHLAPARVGRLDADAQEAERGFGDDGAADAHGDGHVDRRHAVRQHVAEDDAQVARALGARRLDELHGLDAQHRARG